MITTIIAALIAILFCAISVSATVAGGLPPGRMLRLPVAVMQFFAFSWCCCAFVTFPVSLTWSLLGRTRKARAEGKQLLTLIGGPANLQGRLVFLGFLDGGMVILYRLAVRNRQFGRIGRLGGMWVTMITLAAFAFQACGLVWEIVGTNAAIGAILGWFLFPRTTENRWGNQTGRV